MKEFPKPVVVVSKCLEFEACRHDGALIHDQVVKKLSPYVEFKPICPEVEIGLGTPRSTIRIVKTDDEKELIQPKTEKNFTVQMKGFAREYIRKLEGVDGFILKGRSPSCGISDAKIYHDGHSAMTKGRGPGLFAEEVLRIFSHLAIEDEGRLKNFTIREHFYIKLFTLAQFRHVKQRKSMKELVQFHSQNKYKFMAYNQRVLKVMGNIVANHLKLPIEEVLTYYEEHLYLLLEEVPKYQSYINVLQHIYGYFKKDLSKAEKGYFLESLDKYRNNMIPLSVLTSMLKSWVLRFDNKYLKKQTIFEPYPEELVSISDSGKGRNYA